jgi:hypothetical protein
MNFSIYFSSELNKYPPFKRKMEIPMNNRNRDIGLKNGKPILIEETTSKIIWYNE